jgi:hypothetical protein
MKNRSFTVIDQLAYFLSHVCEISYHKANLNNGKIENSFILLVQILAHTSLPPPTQKNNKMDPMSVAFFLGIVTLMLLVFYYSTRTKTKYPPLTKSSMWKNLSTSGYQRVVHFYEQSIWTHENTPQDTSTGATYRLRIPGIGSVVVCCDYKLARLLLSGSDEKSIPESEKTILIKNLNIIENVDNLLT